MEEVAVQGPYAVAEVTDALHRLDADRSVQVIVIARGGGSVEDLLPFSDESLIRAVAACQTPVVSAIGHEQDSPLLDLVADVRASRPPMPPGGWCRTWPSSWRWSASTGHAHGARWRAKLDREWSWLMDMRSRPALADPLQEISRREEVVTALAERARRCFATGLERASDEVGHIRGRLLALSPAATLRRGYAIVQSLDGSGRPACHRRRRRGKAYGQIR